MERVLDAETGHMLTWRYGFGDIFTANWLVYENGEPADNLYLRKVLNGRWCVTEALDPIFESDDFQTAVLAYILLRQKHPWIEHGDDRLEVGNQDVLGESSPN